MKNGVVIRKSSIDEVLGLVPVKGKKELEPLKSFTKKHGIPLNILEDHQVTDNAAERHMHMADLWYCLEGQVIFTYGGTMPNATAKIQVDGSIDEREWKSKEIIGGETVTLSVGDWLWIPAGVPHQHQSEGTARLVIVKIPDESE